MRRVLCRLRPAMTAQPVEPVVGMPAQVFPGEREVVQMQRVQVRGSRIPRLGAAIDHDATSLRTGLAATEELRATSVSSERHGLKKMDGPVKTDWLRRVAVV